MGGRESGTTTVCQYLNTKKEAVRLKDVGNCSGRCTKQVYTAAKERTSLHMVSRLKMAQ